MFYYLYSCICVYIISNVRDLAGLSFDRPINLELTTSEKGHRRLRIKSLQIHLGPPPLLVFLAAKLDFLEWFCPYRNTHRVASVTARHGLPKGLFDHSSHGHLARRRLPRT